MRPELPTASAGSSQAPTAAVDNSASLQPARSLFISRGKTVQTSGATSAANVSDLLQLAEQLRGRGKSLVEFYLNYPESLASLADELSVPDFSATTKTELNALLGGGHVTDLVVGFARFKQYGDHHDLDNLRKSVSRILKRRGTVLPRGKRTNPGLEDLVSDLVPIFLHLGLPLASSERSKIVRALRLVADEQGVPGDPRDELRRLIREHQAISERSKKVVQGIFANAIRSALKKSS